MRWQHRHQMRSDRQRRHSLLLIIASYFVREAAISVPGPRNVRFGIADFPRFSSLCGTKPTCRCRRRMSAVGREADMATPGRYFAFLTHSGSRTGFIQNLACGAEKVDVISLYNLRGWG